MLKLITFALLAAQSIFFGQNFSTAGSSIAVVGAVGTGRNAGTITSVATGQGTSATPFSCPAGDAAAVGLSTIGTAISSGSPTVIDSASNSGWTAGPTQYTAQTLWWFYNTNLGSSITSATVSFTSTNLIAMVAAYCISGTTHNFDSTMEQINNITSSSTTFSSGTFTTSHASEIVLSMGWSELLSTATAPAVLGANYNNSGQIFSLSTIYSTTQTGVVQSGTVASAATLPSSTIGLY